LEVWSFLHTLVDSHFASILLQTLFALFVSPLLSISVVLPSVPILFFFFSPLFPSRAVSRISTLQSYPHLVFSFSKFSLPSRAPSVSPLPFLVLLSRILPFRPLPQFPSPRNQSCSTPR
ncbi:hypothetical protein PFISCL1PPCAC_2792, partial [Pristionchus fissidentatus]